MMIFFCNITEQIFELNDRYNDSMTIELKHSINYFLINSYMKNNKINLEEKYLNNKVYKIDYDINKEIYHKNLTTYCESLSQNINRELCYINPIRVYLKEHNYQSLIIYGIFGIILKDFLLSKDSNLEIKINECKYRYIGSEKNFKFYNYQIDGNQLRKYGILTATIFYFLVEIHNFYLLRTLNKSIKLNPITKTGFKQYNDISDEKM